METSSYKQIADYYGLKNTSNAIDFLCRICHFLRKLMDTFKFPTLLISEHKICDFVGLRILTKSKNEATMHS